MGIGLVGCCAIVLGELHSFLFFHVSTLAMDVFNCIGTEKDLLWRGPDELEVEEGRFHSLLYPSNTLIGYMCF